MRVIITGGTGFIGEALTRLLCDAGYNVVIVTRNAAKVIEFFDGRVSAATWEGKNEGNWEWFLNGAKAVINLAGENIASGYWTRSKKKRILQSRVRAGSTITDAIRRAEIKPEVVVQASAVGYYGNTGKEVVNEHSPGGGGFLADVCRAWEASTKAVEDMGVRRIVIRTGIVLGPGGFLEPLARQFKYHLGGYPGSGEQGLSWIHRRDEIRAIRFLMERQECSGVYDLTSPNPVDIASFSRVLGHVTRKASWLRIPAGLIKIAAGDMAEELFLSGQFALPDRLLEEGFQFDFPQLEDALQEILI